MSHLLDNAVEASPGGRPCCSALHGHARGADGRHHGPWPGHDRRSSSATSCSGRCARPSRGGSGIGAWQARELLREAGGDLVVLSRPGAGTTMRLHLPPAAQRRAPSGHASSDRRSRRPSLSKPKLLVVEDDPGLCAQYRWAFPDCRVRHRHRSPPGGGDGAARSSRPPCCSTSACRPTPRACQRGLRDARRAARDHPQACRSWWPAARASARTRCAPSALGAYDFCEKPVDLDVLRTVVDRALRLRDAGGGEPPPAPRRRARARSATSSPPTRAC